jgi:hypothetical protein
VLIGNPSVIGLSDLVPQPLLIYSELCPHRLHLNKSDISQNANHIKKSYLHSFYWYGNLLKKIANTISARPSGILPRALVVLLLNDRTESSNILPHLHLLTIYDHPQILTDLK